MRTYEIRLFKYGHHVIDFNVTGLETKRYHDKILVILVMFLDHMQDVRAAENQSPTSAF